MKPTRLFCTTTGVLSLQILVVAGNAWWRRWCCFNFIRLFDLIAAIYWAAGSRSESRFGLVWRSPIWAVDDTVWDSCLDNLCFVGAGWIWTCTIQHEESSGRSLCWSAADGVSTSVLVSVVADDQCSTLLRLTSPPKGNDDALSGMNHQLVSLSNLNKENALH